MSRLTKFRGYDSLTNKWVYGSLIQDRFPYQEECDAIYTINKHSVQTIAVHPKTVGLWTGLKDKNDQEIYEGDVVSVYDKDNLFEVCFGKIERKVVGYNDNSIYEVEINKLEFNGFYFRSLKDGKAYLSIVNNKFGEHDLKWTEIVGNAVETRIA